MNKALLKNYAPQARQDFIAAVIARAQRIGITEKGISSAEKSGDSIIIDGQAYPAKFGQKRDKLVARRVGLNKRSQSSTRFLSILGVLIPFNVVVMRKSAKKQ